MSVMLYGHWDDQGSFANVSRALCRALRRRGLSGSVFAVRSLQPRYQDVAWPVGLDSRAAVGICVDYPLASVGYLDGHPYRILVTACEANRVPRSWVDAANQADLLVVPSVFCQRAYQDSGVRTRVMVVPHGVDERAPFFRRVAPEPFQPVRLLHVTGAASFPKRKGTSALLAAFARLVKEPVVSQRVQLTLRMFETQGVRDVLQTLGIEEYVTLDRVECPDPLSMVKHLCTFDGVVQPSRGEGFGMVPLEARCVGVPVVMTADTGHLTHYVPDLDVRVATGDYEPIATQGNDVGAAPTVSVNAVYDALKKFMIDLPARQKRAAEWADRNAKEWVWPKVLSPLTRHVASYAQSAGPMRLGQEAGLRGR